MIKYYCDVCRKQMPNGETDRLRRKLDDVIVEVLARYKGTWNAGQLCHGCIVAAVTKGKPTTERLT